MMELKDLCGKHIFSGCELTSEKRELWGYEEECQVCLFTLDGVTYKAIENPDDGYRSFCEGIETSEDKPRYSFPGVETVCHMMDDGKYEEDDVLVIRDAINGKIILEVGTKNYNDYYPYCHFEYTPENMECNQ